MLTMLFIKLLNMQLLLGEVKILLRFKINIYIYTPAIFSVLIVHKNSLQVL